MAFKNTTNSGVSDSDLARGYSDTGAIPEVGGSISGAQAEADKRAKHEREERKMAEKYGWDYTEPSGGFLDDCTE